jgi:hypothetical protein
MTGLNQHHFFSVVKKQQQKTTNPENLYLKTLACGSTENISLAQ